MVLFVTCKYNLLCMVGNGLGDKWSDLCVCSEKEVGWEVGCCLSDAFELCDCFVSVNSYARVIYFNIPVPMYCILYQKCPQMMLHTLDKRLNFYSYSVTVNFVMLTDVCLDSGFFFSLSFLFIFYFHLYNFIKCLIIK